MSKSVEEEVQAVIGDYMTRVVGGGARPDQAVLACTQAVMEVVGRSKTTTTARKSTT